MTDTNENKQTIPTISSEISTKSAVDDSPPTYDDLVVQAGVKIIIELEETNK